MTKSKDYWRGRFELLEDTLHKDAESCLPEIDKIYRMAQRDIEKDILRWYQRLAKNNEVSMAEARRLLSADELEEFKWTLEDYIKHGKENAIDQRWVKQLENASAKYHISKLEALKLQVQQSLELIYGNQLDMLDEQMRRQYQEGYYRTAFEVQKGFSVGIPLASIDQNKLDKLIKKPWAPDGKNFSDRVWQNKVKLVSEIHTELTRMCITGASPDQAIKNIAKKMNTSRYNAGRLVMTEAAYFSSVAEKDSFNDLGVEQYEILATLDSHTSAICQEMDGKVFDMKDYEAGVTAPPFHVWCRSTTVPYFNDEFTAGEMRAARGADGKTYHVPADMKYPEWKKQFTGGGKPKTEEAEFKISSPGSTKSFKRSLKAIQENKAGLDRRRSNILKHLHSEGDVYRLKKDSITERDLAYLSAAVKVEFALFRSKHEDILIRGNARTCNVTGDIAEEILSKKYEWVAHTHVDRGVLTPSPADKETLRMLGQEKSVIVGMDGSMTDFMVENN